MDTIDMLFPIVIYIFFFYFWKSSRDDFKILSVSVNSVSSCNNRWTCWWWDQLSVWIILLSVTAVHIKISLNY